MNTSERWRVSSAVTPSTLLRYLESAASSSTPWMEYCGTNLVMKTPVACIEVWEQHCCRFLHQISNFVWKQNSKSSADLQVKQTIIKLSFFFFSKLSCDLENGSRLLKLAGMWKTSMGSNILQSSKYLSSIVPWEKVSVHILFLFVWFCQHWTCTGKAQLFHLTYMSNKNENILDVMLLMYATTMQGLNSIRQS